MTNEMTPGRIIESALAANEAADKINQLAAIFERLDAGEMVDASLSNGILRSSKEIMKCGDNCYMVCHLIDGTDVFFTRGGLTEALLGSRSLWDGDLTGDEDPPDDSLAPEQHSEYRRMTE